MNKPDKSILDINLNKLEDEAKDQPKLSYEWGMALVEARKVLRDREKQLKLISAQLEQKIRSSPETYGIDKITESNVKSTILLQDEYQNADEELSQAEYEKDVLDTFFKCLNDRKGELDILSKLHANMYWSKPDTINPQKDSRKATMRDISKNIGK